MSDSFWLGFWSALVAIALGIIDRRAKWRDDETKSKLSEVVHQTNSIKDELVAEVRKSAHAEGVKEEKANPTG